ncbi:MAG: ABC transporter substrate-binding protein [Psychromonas sp.]|nr:ABC transporter substrate-binding protein [Alteromonadales bacterium]MCP5078683.1 ABC transporter substrate-binding protein [Psychromonas sp.]
MKQLLNLKYPLFMLLLTASHSLFASQILTTTPVTYMLATQLMKGSKIETEYLAPHRYAINRLPNWFKGKGQGKAQQAAQKASVVITLGSVWPQDPLYIFSRQANINIIEIDASQAKTVTADSVATRWQTAKIVSPYVWLNSNNLVVMSKIVADDLKRIWPQHNALIEMNQEQLLSQVQLLINSQQQLLFDKGIDAVVLLSDKLLDFVSGNQLFVVKQISESELQWSEQQKLDLIKLLKSDASLWVISDKKSNQFIKQQLPEFKQYLHIDLIDRMGSKGIDKSLPLQRWYF